MFEFDEERMRRSRVIKVRIDGRNVDEEVAVAVPRKQSAGLRVTEVFQRDARWRVDISEFLPVAESADSLTPYSAGSTSSA